MNRYKIALAQGRRAYEEAIEEDKELLAYYGFVLLSCDSGICMVRQDRIRKGKVHPWNTMTIESKVWAWLRPLLIELREARADPSAALSLMASN